MSEKMFDRTIDEGLKRIQSGIDMLDRMSKYSGSYSPSDGQFAEIKRLKNRLDQHVWK